LGALSAGAVFLAAAQTASFSRLLSARACLLLLALAHLPFVRAIFRLYRVPAAAPAVASTRRRLFLLSLCTLSLMPFLVFWRDCPRVGFFAANSLAAILAEAGLLATCTRLARAVSRDAMQAFDARAAGCAIPLLFATAALSLLAAVHWQGGLAGRTLSSLFPLLVPPPRSVLFAAVLPHLSCALAVRRVRNGLLDGLLEHAP